MAASTVVDASSTVDQDRVQDEVVTTLETNPYRAVGQCYLKKIPQVTLATTSLDDVGDKVTIYTFPANATCIAIFGTITDVDTNVSPALEFKMTVGGTDALTGIDAGQAGGTFSGLVFQDAGSEALEFEVTTAAATAAAGTLDLYVLESSGLAWS